MKKSIGILFVFLFFVSSIYAACSSDQTIVRLYRENNSHVSAFDDVNYNISVCYTDLWDKNYTGPNPHSCEATNSNVVFWVNSTRNSHISEVNSPEFNIPVCYGNLRCSFKPSCDLSTEVLLLKASDIENAHVSLTQPEYNKSVCCKNSLSITDAYWSDLNGNETETANLGDTVLMVVQGSEFEDKELNYTLVNVVSESKWYAGVVSWFNEFFGNGKGLQTVTKEWTADKSGKFRFIVNVVGTNTTSQSFSDLSVSSQEVNTLPFVNITSDKLVYTDNRSNVSFNAIVYDKEDFLTVVWDYADGTNDTKNHYSLATEGKSYLNTTHLFSRSGRYVVKLTAREENPQRNQRSSDSSEVYVFSEGINVIPIISSPRDGVYDYGNLVRFNASESFVANCSYTAFRERYDLPINGTTMNCVYIHAPGRKALGENYNLEVEWILKGVNLLKGVWGEATNVDAIASGTIENFLKYFPNADRHVAQLRLTFTPKEI